MREKNDLRERLFGAEPLDVDAQLERYASVADHIEPLVRDTGAYLRQADRDGKHILFEAAQGVMLDLDHGTYPFVTSSSTGVGGIAPGSGFPPQRLGEALGIAKAYCTRVGEGPFPTELDGAVGEELRERGHEYGATTGRPRRCGWFEAVAVRYALELNGAEELVITNLDVLTGFDELRCAVAYEVDGERLASYPSGVDLAEVRPVYEARPGWSEDLTGVRSHGDLPEAAREYVAWIEELVGARVSMLSVGPDREQVIPMGLGGGA